MKYTESWLENTALDYDMEIEELRSIVRHHSQDDDIYETLEILIAARAYAAENGF